ncbi:hypothetical protein A2U01_0044548, partial [Trifolium medium]|nr:hypothetical protein [Trifolium medium]
MFADNGGHDSR